VKELTPSQIGVSLALEAHRRGFLDDPTLQEILTYCSSEASHLEPPDRILVRLGRLTDGQLRVVLETGRRLTGVPQPPAVESGRSFGSRLTLFERLGAGAMGTVFRAHDRVLQRAVAVKVLKLDDVDDPARRTMRLRRFEREAQVMARVRHPSVVGVYDAGVTQEGEPYLVMELVSGESLAKALKERAPLDPILVARWGLSLAEAVEACHVAGVIHRDIKPANVLIDTEGQARLTDFGVAHDDEARTRLTADHGAIGTLAYMAPEQLSGGTADRRTDIYALGATLHEALTASTLFAAPHPAVLLRMILEAKPQDVRATRPECPVELEAVVLKCLAKSPDDRYASAGHLARDLARVVAGAPVAGRSRARTRRSPLVKWGAVLGLAVLAGGAASIALRRTDQDGQAAPSLPELSSIAPAATTSGPGPAPADPVTDVPTPQALPTSDVVEDLGDGRGVTRRGGVPLVWVPAGTASQGAPVGVALTKLDPARRTVHFEKGFWIGRTEVTRAEYARYCAATGTSLPSRGVHVGKVEQALADDQPVVQVDWSAATAYAAWVGGRLPTADEWEYAARGVDGRPWPWGSGWSNDVRRANVSDSAYGRALGSEPPLDEIVRRLDDGFPALAPVGSFPEGRSPFGCLDMIGNVSEWLSDRDPAGKPLVLGGSWQLSDWGARPWARFGVNDATYENVGLRVVVDGP